MSSCDELSSRIREYVAAASKGQPSTCASNATAGSATAAVATSGDVALERRVQSMLTVGEECISEAELRTLLKSKGGPGQPNFILYDGFEPSGRMHIAQGIFKAINVNKCTAAGGTFKFWVADWFALMNNKMGGNLDIIKDVGKYLIEVWKSSGMRMEGVQFIWCEHFLGELAEKYWTQMLDISRCSNLTRIKKCGMIMGRDKPDDLSSAQILYPIMQCTDIFALSADICQLGVDQRKVNMLARDYCDAAGRKSKPVILSHHMLYGLGQGQAKMAKSNPDSAIFMEDGADDVERKLMKAYCPKIPGERDRVVDGKRSVTVDSKQMPPVVTAISGYGEDETDEIKVGDVIFAVNDSPIGECIGQLQSLLRQKPVTLTVKTPSAAPKQQLTADDDNAMRLVKDDLENPILDYIKYIVLGPDDAAPIEIDGKQYTSEQDIREAFCAGGYESKGAISKQQLKRVVIERVNEMLQSSRKHFTENAEAKRLLELVESHKTAIKDGKVPVPQTVRCLKKVKFAKKSKRVGVVFAPRPPTVAALSIDVVLSTLVALNQAAQGADRVVLWCDDWASFCLNSCSSATIEEALKLIKTWYRLLADSLKLVAPGIMEAKVEVMIQSEQILKDPNAYWISAIDVGRTFKLDRVRASLLEGENLTESSQVITTLTHAADLLALSAVEGLERLCVVPVPPLRLADGPAAVPVAAVLSANAHSIAAAYISETIHPKAQACKEKIVVPEVASVAAFKDVALEVLVGDGEPAINGKVKKLFCLAGDIENNPCIDLLEKLDAAGQLRPNNDKGEFLIIKGSEKSGHLNDRCFPDADAVRKEFAKGEAAIHPGDLKGSIGPLMRAVLGPLLQCKVADFVTAHKDLAAAAKKAGKKK